jgi:hypothetical protein
MENLWVTTIFDDDRLKMGLDFCILNCMMLDKKDMILNMLLNSIKL